APTSVSAASTGAGLGALPEGGSGTTAARFKATSRPPWIAKGSTAGSRRAPSPLLHRADLTEDRRGVEIRTPPLHLPVLIVDDEGHGHLHRLVRGRDTRELAPLGPSHGALADDGVALRHGPLDLVVDVGQSGPKPGMKLTEPSLVHGSDHRIDECHVVPQVLLE